MGNRFLLIAMLLMALCVSGEVPTTRPAVEDVGRLEYKPITESSGIVKSRQFEGVFWTHNDSGNPAAIYAVRRNGKLINEFNVAAKNIDWEDIAIDDGGHLFIGDIGNNGAKKTELFVHQVDEPDPANTAARWIPVARTWRLRFPAEPFDCESLFVWKDHGYVISKQFNGLAGELYRFPLAGEGSDPTLERVSVLPINAPITAADLSNDGKYLAVLNYKFLWRFEVNGDLSNLDKKPRIQIQHDTKMAEACCFDGEDVLITSENRNIRVAHPPGAKDQGPMTKDQ